MSIEIVKCQNCGKEITWKEIGDTCYFLRRETLRSKCDQCYDYKYDKGETAFCSLQCFTTWVENHFYLPNPSKRVKK